MVILTKSPTAEPQTTPTWEAEMLRLQQRGAWRRGWTDAAVCCVVIAFLAWSLT